MIVSDQETVVIRLQKPELYDFSKASETRPKLLGHTFECLWTTTVVGELVRRGLFQSELALAGALRLIKEQLIGSNRLFGAEIS